LLESESMLDVVSASETCSEDAMERGGHPF
jgi:hypothetical protein